MKLKKHSADSMFSFLLLLMFCLFTLMVAGTGAAIYRNTILNLNKNYTSRTAIAYISEKIRQHDSQGSISLSKVEELPALRLSETIEQETFFTYIYYHDGDLRELFIREEMIPEADMGTSIVELSSFTLEPHSSGKNLLQITACSEDGQTMTALIHPSSQ